MSNDLISRKALLMEFRCSYNGRCLGGGKECEKCNDFVCRFKDVQNQPTAYDLDEIVRQLEKEAHRERMSAEFRLAGSAGYNEAKNIAKGIDRAIEIVKGGAE